MVKSFSRLLGIAVLILGPLRLASAQPASLEPAHDSTHRALLDRYCVTCHNQTLRTAELTLDVMDVDNLNKDAQLWEKVIRKLGAGQMPPKGMPRPETADIDALVSTLKKGLDRAAAAHPNPGRTPAHRLNRNEYSNAIRDLLAVTFDGEAVLPADNADFGFDNIAEVLSVSPLLMEKYMMAARKVSRLAIGDPTIRPTGETYKLPQFLMQDERTDQNLLFGSRGGLAIAHRFPLDGEYTIKIQLQRNNDGYIRGLRDAHLLDVRVEGERIKLFTVGGEYRGRTGPIYSRNDPDYRGDPEQVDYEFSADADLEVRFRAKAGSHQVGVAFLKDNSKPEGVYTPRLLVGDMRQFRGGNPAIDSVTITGPFGPTGAGETLSRNLIFICSPQDPGDEKPCAEKILSKLARRAYRRTLTGKDLKSLLELFETGRSQAGFEAGIQLALQRILAGPEFLFRIERDPAGLRPGSNYRISDFDLASRLSFFLWSSIPDEELLELAESGRLREPQVLENQIQRMLDDPRAEALMQNFSGQWLTVRHVRQVSPDPDLFPEFDENLREALQQETALLFESMLREDRSVLDLLRADYTYLNERLARHYGVSGVYGSHFRRVAVRDEARKGLLGQGSILTVTSRENRTSPVLRGKWVLENLLGTPPPPPPPDVPALEASNQDNKAMTVRQQMEHHRANPACSGCHNLMDPIGFALENFDALGRWRNSSRFGSEQLPIDASGVLPDGTEIDGSVEFRRVLLENPDQFLHTVTEKLLTYALGRGLEYYDVPAVRHVLREAAPGGYRWSSLITGIVNSTPFQMRRSRQP